MHHTDSLKGEKSMINITEQILKTDYAYLAFDTPEELDKIRLEYEAKGEVFSYDNVTRNSLRNSLALSER